MRASSCANDVRAACFAIAGVLLVVGCGKSGKPGARKDGGSAPAPADVLPVDADSGGAPIDATPTAVTCPAWSEEPAEGYAWAYAIARASGGESLDINELDVFVRKPGDALPGVAAKADAPCFVSRYETSTEEVTILAAAVGFSTQERTFSPGSCAMGAPCSIALPPAPEMKLAYYKSAPGMLRVLHADEIPPAEREAFVTALAADAKARSRALRSPLAKEVNRSLKVTRVPAEELSRRFTKADLRAGCGRQCRDELEPGFHDFLRRGRTFEP